MSTTGSLKYHKLISRMQDAPLTAGDTSALDAPDRRDGRIYHMTPELHLTVEVALATGRPLLLRGDPGSGKSSLAAYVARNLNYRYYEHTVTSQTQAQDLLWKFDLVRRLADAQQRSVPGNQTPLNDFDYVDPASLWWVFDRDSARNRGWSSERGQPPSTLAQEPNQEINKTRDQNCAVVLIDELDKADPDVPNALLVPLGSMQFRVPEINVEVKRKSLITASMSDKTKDPRERSSLLVVITTNEERELPAAFLRRCIAHKLDHPDWQRLVDIARLHFNRPPTFPFTDEHKALATDLAKKVEKLREERSNAGRRPPGTAEFLDAVRACITLEIGVNSGKTWEILAQATLLKDEGDGV